jgi:hypothetical protein
MIRNAEFFEGTGMPDPGWWEALWPDPAGVLAKVGLKPGMDVIEYVQATVGSVCKLRRSPATSLQSILTASSLTLPGPASPKAHS